MGMSSVLSESALQWWCPASCEWLCKFSSRRVNWHKLLNVFRVFLDVSVALYDEASVTNPEGGTTGHGVVTDDDPTLNRVISHLE